MFVRKTGSYNISEVTGVEEYVPQGSLNGRKLALISGAGPAGLAAAFELQAKGCDVVVVEKRKEFSRFNIINLNREAQTFLRKFNLLEEFESSVASRIRQHQIVVFGSSAPRAIATSDVSQLQFEGELDKDPSTFNHLFQEDGIYSVQIKDLQAFLAHKAAQIGVRILAESKINIVEQLEGKGVSKIEIQGKSSVTLEPDLLFIAEGAHSTMAQELGMVDLSEDVVNNVCSGENWVFGNLNYRGSETFVVSMIITAQKTLQIANVIFNAKCGSVNVAVTSDRNPSEGKIKNLIKDVAEKAFHFGGVSEVPEVLEVVAEPVSIVNRRASECSKGNIFRIGDAVGNSSPLAGLGGTLGLTLIPCTVEQLMEDYQERSIEVHNNFKMRSQAYVNKWIDKSESVKKAILRIKEAEDAN